MGQNTEVIFAPEASKRPKKILNQDDRGEKTDEEEDCDSDKESEIGSDSVDEGTSSDDSELEDAKARITHYYSGSLRSILTYPWPVTSGDTTSIPRRITLAKMALI